VNRTRLPGFVALMILLQLFTVVAEAHAFESFESQPSSHDVVHQATSDTHSIDSHADTDDQENAVDHIRHCSHHSCHCPLLLTGPSPHSSDKNIDLIQNGAMDRVPDAPISSLFRPPIA
jgi:hypothetical protein